MQQNGAGDTPNGDAAQLSISTASSADLLPVASSSSSSSSSRLRRLNQDGRAVPPQPTVMVVFSSARDSGGDSAMSKSEEEKRRATLTTASRNLAKPLRSLNAPQEFPEVVPLNVGGTYFTTRLSTLRRYEDTMLAAIEAQYYSIGPLLERLEDRQPLTGEKVRQAFLDLLPYYKENLERIVEIAKLRAMQRKARFAKLKVCVYKEEMPITPYERPLFNSLRFERSESEAKLFEHHCEVDVSFGPWEAVADVYDLLHCIVSDLAERGISVDQQCIGVCDKHLINHYYCKRPIYEFKITWW
ncbi:BTB/POZ domain-containing protein KCTD7 [Bagarius yarrelli]|uniref:BTB/POZ domain-containing protein KCTD7 n=1 Tax=Bagarius yarrelli TaxID=175774 RepID=A0A556VUV0_BAGYA|nr:BTB/POZ domain-containing protein KCTD7 [Bagarius yarrelli]